MKKYTNRIKLMPKFTKCMSLAMILTFTGYEEAFAEVMRNKLALPFLWRTRL